MSALSGVLTDRWIMLGIGSGYKINIKNEVDIFYFLKYVNILI